MTNSKNKGKNVGRPQSEINWELLDSVLELGARLIDCSDFLKVSEDTIQNKIRERFGLTFSQYRDKKLSKMRMKLLQKQFEIAMKGNVALLIWLGKQHLGQSDKQEIVNDSKVSLKLSHDEKKEMAEAYLKNLTIESKD